jgi:hypothetical protein
MKKINILNIKNNQTYGATLEDPTEWINYCINNNNWGKPIRWQLASEAHDESDIINTESRVNLNGIPEDWVQLRAEYTIEIIDLDSDPAYLLELCYKNRRAEYPPVTDYLDAVVKNDQVAVQAYIDACLAVKAKYPKPGVM